jgi:hypothetical protein
MTTKQTFYVCSKLLLAALLVSLAVTSCGGEGTAFTPESEDANVTVTLRSGFDFVERGGRRVLNVTVTGTLNKAVTWSLSEGAHADTKVTGDMLSVALDEPLDEITVRAASASHPESYDEVTLFVTTPSSPVESIRIIPAENYNPETWNGKVSIRAGNNFAFTAEIKPSTEVFTGAAWSIDPLKEGETKLQPGTGFNLLGQFGRGILAIDPNERVGAVFTIKAELEGVSDTVEITVTQ